MTRGSSWIATYRHNTKLPVKRSCLAESSSSSFQAVPLDRSSADTVRLAPQFQDQSKKLGSISSLPA